MGEVERIVDQLQRAFAGDAWHGPSLKDLLADVDAEAAGARPIPGAHTIAEIVAHVSTWTDVVRRRLEGEWIGSLPPEQDWPAPGPPRWDEAAWSEALRRLAEAQRGLAAAMARVGDQRLPEVTPEKEYSVYVMLHGAVQHALYHAGQIALLKRARAGA
jgi:uncharacterized damage-inducible protein DinB